MNVFPSKFRFSFVKDGEITYCKYSPEEWNDNVINWNRDKDNAGILVKYTTSFSFIMDDADYLRECFKTKSVFAKVLFVVEQYDYDKFEYHPYYTGDIDFYSYEESKFKVSITTTNIGYRAALLANLDTTYEVDIPDGSDFVRYNRLHLKNIINYDCSWSMINIQTAYRYWLNCDRTQNDVLNDDIESKLFVDGGKTYPEGWLCKANKNATLCVKIKYDVKTTNTNSTYYKPQVYLRFVTARGDKEIFADIDGNSWTSSPSFGKDNFSGEKIFSFDLNVGDLFYLQLGTQNSTAGSVNTLDVKISLEMYYNSRGKSVDICGLHPIELLEVLVKKVTGDKYSAIKSNLLSKGEVKNMLITSGDLIRGISGGKIKTSLKDFFQAMKSMFGASYTFRIVNGQETLEVEHVNYFYDGNTIMTELTDIKDLSMKVKDSDIYNKLKIGYKDNTYDEINGKNEFNTSVEFSIDTSHNAKTLNLVSPYRADMYGIEFTILEYDPKETTDSSSDNDVFVIHAGGILLEMVNGSLVIVPNGYRINRSYKILNTDNLAGDTAFNVYLSPKRCLMRQIEYIKSLFMLSGPLLKFASSTKNFNVTSTGNVVEHDDVDLSKYTNLFQLVQYEFETMVPGNISELIDTNYRGYVLARDGERVIKGFIDSASDNPGRNKSQKWKLLEAGY